MYSKTCVLLNFTNPSSYTKFECRNEHELISLIHVQVASCVYHSLSYWLCVFQVYNRWCVCMEVGWRNSRRYVRLDIIQRNLRRKWELSAKSSADFLYEMWHYMYHLFQTDIFYHLKNGRHADILPFRFHHFPFSVSRVF